jgi:hypothetical protein
MFYSNEEFEAQMKDLQARGLTYAQAYDIVRRREQEDAEEYDRWRREAGGNDSWYDDQYEVDCE